MGKWYVSQNDVILSLFILDKVNNIKTSKPHRVHIVLTHFYKAHKQNSFLYIYIIYKYLYIYTKSDFYKNKEMIINS